MKRCFLITVALYLFIVSCGGGGGEYYPPEIAIDKIGVVKEEIRPDDIADITKHDLENLPNLTKDKEEDISGNTGYCFRHFSFKNENYKIGIGASSWVSIIDTDGKYIKVLETPRYTNNARAVELIGKNGQRVLAIYIEQQATSHSSTLYLLSEEWDILYKEHLLGAKWIAKEKTDLGDNLIISAETKWRPNKEWITVGGPWRYKIFKS